MSISIRIGTLNDSEIIAAIVRKANIPIANQLKITTDKHPSNCKAEWIITDIERGVEYFVAEKENIAIGCIAFEKPENGTAYLNRLAVLPEYQNNGIGRELVDFHFSYAKKHKIKNVSIGIINEHSELKNWYKKIGFIETEIKHFDHLPFTVCLMNYRL